MMTYANINAIGSDSLQTIKSNGPLNHIFNRSSKNPSIYYSDELTGPHIKEPYLLYVEASFMMNQD